MTDKIVFDSADIIATKQDFIDLMDENARLQQEVKDIRTDTLKEVNKVVENVPAYCSQLHLILEAIENMGGESDGMD